jgi:DNA-binding phage protein
MQPKKPINERVRRQLEKLSPEDRAKAEAAIARTQVPEFRAEMARAREALDQEFRETGTIASRGQSEAIRHVIELLRRAMKETGTSLTELSKRSGVDLPALSRIMSGQNANPSVPTLEKIAGAMGFRLAMELAPLATGA